MKKNNFSAKSFGKYTNKQARHDLASLIDGGI